MSNPIQTLPTGETQAPFGNGAVLPDPTAECKKWESLCAELVAERDKLREQLAKVQAERNQYLKSLYYYIRKEAPAPTFTKEPRRINFPISPQRCRVGRTK